MKRKIIEKDRDLFNRAQKDTLRSLLNLTESDPDNYHSAVSITIGMEEGDYGVISPADVPELLKKYIEEELVLNVNINYTYHSRRGKFMTGYLANMKKKKHIEDEIMTQSRLPI